MAVGLLLQGRLTLGQAGAALGLSKPALMEAMNERRLPMPYDERDAVNDLDAIRRLWPNGDGAPARNS